MPLRDRDELTDRGLGTAARGAWRGSGTILDGSPRRSPTAPASRQGATIDGRTSFEDAARTRRGTAMALDARGPQRATTSLHRARRRHPGALEGAHRTRPGAPRAMSWTARRGPGGDRGGDPRAPGLRLRDLRARRSTACRARAPPTPQVVIVGEAPGAAEDKSGRPFVGGAGRLLDALLEQAGLDRERRLHHQRRQGAAARQPRPKQAGGRALPAVAARAARRSSGRAWSCRSAATRSPTSRPT